MISKEDSVRIVLQEVPGFRERWQAYLDDWDGEETRLCNDMVEFSRYIKDLILPK